MFKILFIQTGGTIDKDYPQGEDNHGYGFEIGESAVISILENIHPKFDFEIVSLLKKDSLDITAADRLQLKEKIDGFSAERIIITHGTDTILDTARTLSGIEDKVIVLTGAMLPEKFKDSDAMFNLGMAVGGVQTLGNGVYIALFGRIVPWSDFENL